MRQLRRLLSALFILLGAITVIPVFSGIASAHHSNITASVACTGTVSWTATSWSTGAEGTNTTILVTKTVNGVTTSVGQGAFNLANQYQFSGNFTWPTGATSIIVTSTPNAAWGNGVVSNVGSSVTVNKPSNCPGQPGVSKVVSCTNSSPGHGDGTVTLTLSNTGSGPFASNSTFTVYNPDQTTTSTPYTVAPGLTKNVAFGGLADGSHTVKIVAGSTDLSQTFSVDCDSPIPSSSLAVTCANGDGQVVVTLNNAGGKAVTFDVTDPKTNTVEHVTVNADSSTTRTFSGFADGNYTLTIKVGNTDLSKPFTIDCDHAKPKVSSKVVCDASDGSITITLDNKEGTEAVTFDVTDPTTQEVKHITVNFGTEQTITFGGLSDGQHSVLVTADGQNFTQTFTVSCDAPSSATFTQTCVEGENGIADGKVDVTLHNNSDDVVVTFFVNGAPYPVGPNDVFLVSIGGLADGITHIVVRTSADGPDIGFDVTVKCDHSGAGSVSYVAGCADYDGVVSVTLTAIGGEKAVEFIINDVQHVLDPGATETFDIGGLADGSNHITVAVNGEPQADIVVETNCDPVFAVTPICNSVDTSGEVAQFWFTVTNSEASDVSVTWAGGSAVVPAGQSIVVGSSSAPLILQYNGVEIASSGAADSTCERSVIFTKELHGQPQTSETYSIRVSRLVGETYVEEMTFTLNAGETKTINLPSTLDQAGVSYKVEEINAGSASTSTVSPDQLTLAGHLGETIAVVVTNGYAAVQIDKTTSTASVLPGGQITYTLQAVNTGGLTLNPVVVTDRLPAAMELVSATVAGGECSLAEATRPQLISCTMSGSLAPGASASPITVVVKVDATVVAGTTVVNQAMVHGAFVALDGSETLSQKVNNAGSAGVDLSCLPVISGTVCDLSTKVGVPVTQIQVSPPTPATATATQSVAELPRTGASNLRAMLVLGFGAVLLGGALLVSKRRLGAR